MSEPGEAAERQLPTIGPDLNPDQSCVGCAILTFLVLISVSYWGYIYWRDNPELHPRPDPTPRARLSEPSAPPAAATRSESR